MSDDKFYPSSLHRLIRRPKFILFVMLCYLGIGMIAIGITKQDIFPLFREYGMVFAGAFIILIGFVLYYDDYIKRRGTYDESFVSVDERWQKQADPSLYEKLVQEIKDIKSEQNVDYERIESILKKSTTERETVKKELYHSFESYFDGLREVLERKANDADVKASKLLDKGTSYSKNGIFFFICTIVVWQVLSAITGFKEQYIYGIVSCSVLFIFIEFLSAWFLKQYRNFVDTSTYLIKVKSIFDRYMLCHLAITHSTKDVTHLNKVLADDIKWPETYLFKNADVGFAKEAMEAMTYLAKSFKEEAKGKKTDKDDK